jgi:hypothetical protein
MCVATSMLRVPLRPAPVSILPRSSTPYINMKILAEGGSLPPPSGSRHSTVILPHLGVTTTVLQSNAADR